MAWTPKFLNSPPYNLKMFQDSSTHELKICQQTFFYPIHPQPSSLKIKFPEPLYSELVLWSPLLLSLPPWCHSGSWQLTLPCLLCALIIPHTLLGWFRIHSPGGAIFQNPSRVRAVYKLEVFEDVKSKHKHDKIEGGSKMHLNLWIKLQTLKTQHKCW